MSLKRVLKSAAVFFGFRPLRTGQWPDPAHLGATALLVHVARADGRFSKRERDRLEAVVESRFCRSRREARQLLARAEALDHETTEVSSLLEMIGRDSDSRRRILAMAFTVATADGTVHEIEADLVWRLGKLLGFDEHEIEAIKETQTLLTP
jgi:uncharacterized tellurite resistance protein B-like protein